MCVRPWVKFLTSVQLGVELTKNKIVKYLFFSTTFSTSSVCLYIVGERIDDNQFGGVGGISTTDALVEMTHTWYEATDVLNIYVRVVLLDFSKAFDRINHHILVDKLITNGVPAHIVRWLAAFLLDRQQQVKIGNIYSRTGSPNGGVPQGTLSGPKCFFIIYK